MGEKKTKSTKTTELATNVSSGAEKVESIEQEVKQETAKRAKNAKKTAKVGKKKATDKEKAKKEELRAKARVEKALKKQEIKRKKKEEREKRKQERIEKRKAGNKAFAERKARAEKRKAERKARMEKKRAEKQARAEKKLAERKALEEKRKLEREERIRERAHRKANHRQAKNKRNKQRAEQRKERRENRAPGYGGWLATVIALGAVTLGLASVVTVGAIEMNGMQNGMMSAYQGATYELAGIMENVDEDLDRVRLSGDVSQQSRILTDVLVQARLAELDLEKLPISAQSDANLTRFVNTLASEANRMLGKLRNGQALTGEDFAKLQKLYETNHTVRMQLDEYASKMCCKDFTKYMKKGKGALADVLGRLEGSTLEENNLTPNGNASQMDRAGTKQTKDAVRISTAKAEELCKAYFAKYNIKDFQCVGETNARGGALYNVQGYDDRGTQLYAEVDEYTGKLVRFDFFEECNGDKFDKESCAKIAEEFLTSLGYQDMTLVRARRNGSTLDFTYAVEQDGIIIYPDSVRVKVCGTRGVVSGFDGGRYLKNHSQRENLTTAISVEEAESRLQKGVEVEGSRLAVVQTAGGERTAYEFVCSFMEERYLIYIDAVDGNEISIINLKTIA